MFRGQSQSNGRFWKQGSLVEGPVSHVGTSLTAQGIAGEATRGAFCTMEAMHELSQLQLNITKLVSIPQCEDRYVVYRKPPAGELRI